MAEPSAQENEVVRKLVESFHAATATIFDTPAHQFRKDFEQLAFGLLDSDWHLPPEPHANPKLPPFRTYPLPRRLPFGPLRRMARFFGIEVLEYLIELGSDQPKQIRRFQRHNSAPEYKLDLRFRKDNEFPDLGFRRRAWNRELDLAWFGSLVLKYEDQGRARGTAQRLAAQQMGKNYRFKSDRTLIRMFGEYAKLIQRRSHMQNLISAAMGRSPPSLDRVARAKPGAKRIHDKRPK